jgi:Secretion system C-terminal sorting domain
MKSLLLFFLFSTQLLFAQSKNVSLHLNHLLNGEPLEYMKTVKSSNNYYFKVELLRYYISNIILTHDGGKIDTLKEKWVLVDPSLNNTYSLGSFNFNNIENIAFGLGIDKAHNHLDPTVYLDKHPLGLQEPSMHWGWAAGYRFITFEGYAGASEAAVTTNFQIHTLGDQNYTMVNLPIQANGEGDKLTVSLDAEYANLLKDIKATTGPINHGAAGEAALRMKNMATAVFTPSKITGTEDLHFSNLKLFPNPAHDVLTIENTENQAIRIVNALGQVVLYFPVMEQNTVNIAALPSGIYFVRVGKELVRFLKK